MDNRPVLFLDSGIGGIPYCRHFHGRNPGERVVYLADRLHFPYGKRDRDDLVSILSALMKKVIRAVDPKIAALACNTATVSALTELRERFSGLPFVGTVPAVKPAALAAKNGRIGVLGTERTIEDPYIRRLAAECGAVEVCGIAAPALVEFVERRFDDADGDEKREQARKYLEPFRVAGVDTVVLGCTHFLFLLDEFRREAAPDIAVFDSIDGITRRVEYLLDDHGGALRSGGNGKTVSPGGVSENVLFVTGPEAPGNLWRRRADSLDFRLVLWGDT
jgi:glutamate racemase